MPKNPQVKTSKQMTLLTMTDLPFSWYHSQQTPSTIIPWSWIPPSPPKIDSSSTNSTVKNVGSYWTIGNRIGRRPIRTASNSHPIQWHLLCYHRIFFTSSIDCIPLITLHSSSFLPKISDLIGTWVWISMLTFICESGMYKILHRYTHFPIQLICVVARFIILWIYWMLTTHGPGPGIEVATRGRMAWWCDDSKLKLTPLSVGMLKGRKEKTMQNINLP